MQNARAFTRLGEDAREAGLASDSYRPRVVANADSRDFRRFAAWHAICEIDGAGAVGATRDGETVTRLCYGVRKD